METAETITRQETDGGAIITAFTGQQTEKRRRESSESITCPAKLQKGDLGGEQSGRGRRGGSSETKSTTDREMPRTRRHSSDGHADGLTHHRARESSAAGMPNGVNDGHYGGDDKFQPGRVHHAGVR